jgi:ABC-type phosphate transport system substrate-binding protein
VFVAGSSAAQNAFFTGVNTDILGSGGSLYKSSNGNFQAICGVSANALVAPVGDSLLVHYRAEGGSVVGVLPIAAGGSHPLNFLTATGATAVGTLAAPVTLAVTGTSATVGTTDGWGGANLVKHDVDIGVADVEAAQFVGTNYPTAYSAAVFGAASAAQLTAAASKEKPLVDQVFGLFVNTSGLNGGGTGQAINLSNESVANILDGTITDWSQVPTLVGGVAGVASNVAAPIALINRESGSGSRAQASIYFLAYNCGQNTRVISDPSPSADGYATSDVIAAAQSTPGGITYASIDQAPKANLTLASLNGIAPSTLAATSGDYGDWFQARSLKGNTALDAVGTAFYNYIVNTIPTNAKAPQSKQVLTIVNAGVPANAAPALPVVANGVIYTNPYSRGGKSCGAPKKQ